MFNLPLDIVIRVCVLLPKQDLLSVMCCCKWSCENRDTIVLEWIKHTQHVGFFFKIPTVCDGILRAQNTFLLDEMFVRAAFIGRADIVRTCLAMGANCNHRGGEAIVLASRFGYTEIVDMLLESGVDIHARNDEALLCSIANGYDCIANRLIQSGASINSPAVFLGLKVHRQAWIYCVPDIEPWRNNTYPPPPKIKRKTLFDKLVSTVRALFWRT